MYKFKTFLAVGVKYL